MFRTVRCLGLILVLVLLLGAPAASVAGGFEPEELSVHGILSALWERLSELLPLTGSTGDPSGTTSGGGGTDSGPGMDPNGKPTGP